MIRLSLASALLLALAAVVSLPNGLHSARLIAAADDPVALAELGLDRSFDAATATREIEAALAAGDVELAQSFLDLAADRGLALDPALGARVAAAARAADGAVRKVASFARGFVTGAPDDLAGLAGTAAGDLFWFGDVRDVVREGSRMARGREPDALMLGLAGAGLAITAGTYASLGAAVPARVGLSLVKVARRTGRLGAPLMRAIRRQSTEGVVRLAGDLGRVQAKAGTRATLDVLKHADSPKDVVRYARLADAKGSRTRAIVKLLGRGAIVLTTALFDLALWVFWALLNLAGFCVALKRATERMTLRLIRRGKRRAAARALAGAAPAV
ncbi:MAG: hypothetical protein M5U07_26165 [Xanthobacteraceae bacterium]|nr:hypothetical protein [Xanthobacteraceae bacterium]